MEVCRMEVLCGGWISTARIVVGMVPSCPTSSIRSWRGWGRVRRRWRSTPIISIVFSCWACIDDNTFELKCLELKSPTGLSTIPSSPLQGLLENTWKKFSDGEEIKWIVEKWLREVEHEVFDTGIQNLVPHLQKCNDLNGWLNEAVEKKYDITEEN
ncbi:hypothetical protein J437_LFUL010559 [Ladona fulva]|uniref:Uncharacterized protein n=1 Tax=Ladona fulva TaxID=123851 RepID=A0A8K0P5Y0_LADFU|nr:hypothetical protein J437_LFUL010559 [Ladona fulva]